VAGGRGRGPRGGPLRTGAGGPGQGQGQGQGGRRGRWVRARGAGCPCQQARQRGLGRCCRPGRMSAWGPRARLGAAGCATQQQGDTAASTRAASLRCSRGPPVLQAARLRRWARFQVQEGRIRDPPPPHCRRPRAGADRHCLRPLAWHRPPWRSCRWSTWQLMWPRPVGRHHGGWGGQGRALDHSCRSYVGNVVQL
jgi:hypothetical protein